MQCSSRASLLRPRGGRPARTRSQLAAPPLLGAQADSRVIDLSHEYLFTARELNAVPGPGDTEVAEKDSPLVLLSL